MSLEVQWDIHHIPTFTYNSTNCGHGGAIENIKSSVFWFSNGMRMYLIDPDGTLIARGLIEFCDGAPPVSNFLSLARPHAGVAAIPYCEAVDFETPATYYKVPTEIDNYLKISKFLPKLNNERPEERNFTYNDHFSSLKQVGDAHDFVGFFPLLVPKETALFGYYKDGSK
ncbi:palmitoyl-protein thioesterase 1-like [Momordica charantia]|uniref:Palmitoyl-protein thioesterase 1-like n=1 Tax=Momordica charantia TaxID=3673 RepID=A0A6J1DXY8_MOMCH|nr:palmitoyl-protein thioesterase 1-like [Momordica charantia]